MVRLRSIVVVLVGFGAIALSVSQIVNGPDALIPKDFPEYWLAGAVNLRGGDPYDPDELLHWQQLAKPEQTDALMMWNPPWSLAVYMPLGALPVRWAALVWLAVQVLAVMLSCDLLWRTYEGPPRFRWLPQFVALTFVGTWWMITYGQNTGLLLLGLAGFAYYRKTDRPALAGAFAALTALKPHLLAVFGVLLLIDAITRRGRIVLAAGAAVIAASLLAAIVANPDVISQYREATRNPKGGALSGWVLPVGSYWLRAKIDNTQFWIQFVPTGLACLGYAAYRFARRAQWDWPAQLPGIVWLSLLTTAYGGWIFDLPVLLVPLVFAAACIGRARNPYWPAAAVLIGGQVLILIISKFWGLGRIIGLHEFWWVAPAILTVNLATLALARKARS